MSSNLKEINIELKEPISSLKAAYLEKNLLKDLGIKAIINVGQKNARLYIEEDRYQPEKLSDFLKNEAVELKTKTMQMALTNVPSYGLQGTFVAQEIESKVQKLQGVIECIFHSEFNELLVEFQPLFVTPEKIKNQLTTLGFEVECVDTLSASIRYLGRMKTQLLSFVILLSFCAASFSFEKLGMPEGVKLFLLLIGLHLGAQSLYSEVWFSLQKRKINASLITLFSTALLFGFQCFSSSKQLCLPLIPVFCLLGGRFVKEMVDDKIIKGILSSLVRIPLMSWLDVEGKIERVYTQTLLPKVELIVKSNERIPVDGVITEGASYVLEHKGKAIDRVFKSVGSAVFAGDINEGSLIRMRIEKVGNDTLLCKKVEALLTSIQTRSNQGKLSIKLFSSLLLLPQVLLLFFVVHSFFINEGLTSNQQPLVWVAWSFAPLWMLTWVETVSKLACIKSANQSLLIKTVKLWEKLKSLSIVEVDEDFDYVDFKLEEIEEKFLAEEDKKLAMSLLMKAQHSLCKKLSRHLASSSLLPVTHKVDVENRGVAGLVDGHAVALLSDCGDFKAVNQEVASFCQSSQPTLYFIKGQEVHGGWKLVPALSERGKELNRLLSQSGIDPIMACLTNQPKISLQGRYLGEPGLGRLKGSLKAALTLLFTNEVNFLSRGVDVLFLKEDASLIAKVKKVAKMTVFEEKALLAISLGSYLFILGFSLFI